MQRGPILKAGTRVLPLLGLSAWLSAQAPDVTLLPGANWVATRAAQGPPPVQAPAPTFTSGVDIVTLDVSVFENASGSRARRPVRGLTAVDFTITSAGKPLPIVAFKAIALPDRRAYSATWMREIAPDVISNKMEADRVVVLLLDDFNVATDPAHMQQTKDIAHSIVDQLGPDDLAAVVYTYNHENGQNFTADRVRLGAAVDRFVSNAPRLACPHNTCVTLALRAIAQVLQESFPGRRKTVAYVSPEGTYGLGPQNVEQNSFEANAAIFNSEPDLARTFRALQEANVNVYQYDSRGLKESLNLLHGGIGMFADNTGGRTVTRTNDPAARVGEMFDENSSYYLLGFIAPAGASRNPFHQISVKVGRPDVDVRTRLGYFDATADDRKKPPPKAMSALDKAMEGTVPTGDLPMSLTVAPFAVRGPTGAALVIVAGLDRPASMSEKDVVDLAARAFDEASPLRRSNGVATAKLQLSQRPTAAGLVHYDIATRLDVLPSRYEVRLAMNSAATGLTGGGYTSVVVPNFGKGPLTVSGVVVGRLPFAASRGRDPLGGLLPFTPTTTRTFERSDRVGALLRVYQAGKDPLPAVSVRHRIVNGNDHALVDDTTAVTLDPSLPTPRTGEHRLELPLRQLEPGEYLLSIEVTAAKVRQKRHVRFRVK